MISMPILAQPPDPNPKTPKLRLPAGACDTHLHLFGPAACFPFDPASHYISADALPETCIALQERLGRGRRRSAGVPDGAAHARHRARLGEAVGPDALRNGRFPLCGGDALACALVRHAPERLVWGTDWPHVNMNDRAMPNDGDLVDLLGEWVPDESTRKRILVDNACALYGFPAP
jgi:hypothetical protein